MNGAWVKVRKIMEVDTFVKLQDYSNQYDAIEILESKSTLEKNLMFESRNNPKVTFEFNLSMPHK